MPSLCGNGPTEVAVGDANGVRHGHGDRHLRQPVLDLVEALSARDPRWWRSTAGMANRLDPLRPPTHTLVGSGIAQTHAAVSFSDHRPSEGDKCGRTLAPWPAGHVEGSKTMMHRVVATAALAMWVPACVPWN